MVGRVKGNMSAQDIANYKSTTIGKFVMQFRGWIPATMRERVKGEQYNLTMEQFEVGRWMAAYGMVKDNYKRTGTKFLKQLIPFAKADFHDIDINDPSHPMREKYEQYIADNPHLKPDPLNPSMEEVTFEEYYNAYVSELKALATEVQTYLALMAILSMMLLAGGSDELKENPIFRLPVTLIERAMLEIGFYLPLPGLGFEEATQLVSRSPIPSWGTVKTAMSAIENTFTEMYDTMFGADWDKTITPKLGDDAWEIDVSERSDASPWLYYSHQFVPPFKFLESILNSMGITKRKDTVYDYLTDQGTFVYR